MRPLLAALVLIALPSLGSDECLAAQQAHTEAWRESYGTKPGTPEHRAARVAYAEAECAMLCVCQDGKDVHPAVRRIHDEKFSDIGHSCKPCPINVS